MHEKRPLVIPATALTPLSANQTWAEVVGKKGSRKKGGAKTRGAQQGGRPAAKAPKATGQKPKIGKASLQKGQSQRTPGEGEKKRKIRSPGAAAVVVTPLLPGGGNQSGVAYGRGPP